MADKNTRAARWLVLDNLKNGWPASTNLSREFWEPALQWAQQNGYVRDDKLTAEGEGALLIQRLE